MVAIRAFVAHSFTEDDEILVGKFVKYFDQLSKSDMNFSYVHAEAAEPKVLAEKVKFLLANANVLIAICTKKERIISPNVLAETWFPRGFLKAPQREFLWKTSDWIIQEIGLAIGRGLDLILLLEDGVQSQAGFKVIWSTSHLIVSPLNDPSERSSICLARFLRRGVLLRPSRTHDRP